MSSRPVEFLSQNITEGPTTPVIRSVDFGVFQEVHEGRFRDTLPDNRKLWVPARDRNQAIMWNPDIFTPTAKGWTRYHNTGVTEGWPFKTPQRGQVWMKGYLFDDPHKKVVIWGTWLLNSWAPVRPDHYTKHRRRVVTMQELPKLRANIRKWDAKGYEQLGGGDMNSLRWNGDLPRLDQAWDHGLDRVYRSGGFRLLDKFEGPKTGVGNQMRHEAKGIKVVWR